MDYGIIFKKVLLSENLFIFIPIHITKGTYINGEFCDEINKVYCDIDDIIFDDENNEYYISSVISYEELQEKYKNDSEEILKLNYFKEFKDSIIVACFNENDELIQKKVNIKDLINNKNTEEEIYQNEDIYQDEISIYFDLYSMKQLLSYDGDNIKNILRGLVEYANPYEIDYSIKVNLNIDNIYKILITKIKNKESLIPDEEKYNLNFSDIKKINEIFNIEKSIFKLYSNLFNIEQKKGTKNKDYEKNLDYLNIAVDTEKKVYKKLNLTFEKALSILEYIINIRNKEKEYFKDEIDSTFSTPQNLCINRFIRYLKYYILEQYDIFENKINEKLYNLLIDLLGNDIYQYSDAEILKYFRINQFLENQILYTLLNKIADREDIAYSRLKYVISFLNEDCEYNMMIKRPNCNIVGLEIYGYNEIAVNEVKNISCENIIMREFLKLLNISNENCENESLGILEDMIQEKINIIMDMLSDEKQNEIKEKIEVYIIDNLDKNEKKHICSKKIMKNTFGKSKQFKK